MNIHVTMTSSKLQHTAFFESFPKNTEFEIRSPWDEFILILTILILKVQGENRECPGVTIHVAWSLLCFSNNVTIHDDRFKLDCLHLKLWAFFSHGHVHLLFNNIISHIKYPLFLAHFTREIQEPVKHHSVIKCQHSAQLKMCHINNSVPLFFQTYSRVAMSPTFTIVGPFLPLQIWKIGNPAFSQLPK